MTSPCRAGEGQDRRLNGGLLAGLFLLLLASPDVLALADSPASLGFEERVAAQEAIERVYYSHQVGATQPFEKAVSRAFLEEKVSTYLKQSVALQEFWHTPVTADALGERAGGSPGVCTPLPQDATTRP